MRRVVVLTSSYPRDADDFAGRFVADAVVRLRARGLEVDVVHPERPADGGGLVRLLCRRPWLVFTLSFTLVRRLRHAARDADLVHGHWLASSVLARLARRPFVVTLHGTGSAGPLSDESLARRAPWLVRFLLRPARAVICVSRPLAETMRAIGVENVRWIPNGVALGAAQRVASEPFVLYVGRLAPEKGITDLVEATRGLPLVVAGDGPLRKLVPTATGFVPHRELARLYERAAVVVFPSHREGLPLALTEAMAHGCAVVATNVGGIPDLVAHGRTGLLVEPGNPQRLRAAIELLLADDALRASLGAEARDHVARLCSWRTVTDATLDAYRRAFSDEEPSFPQAPLELAPHDPPPLPQAGS